MRYVNVAHDNWNDTINTTIRDFVSKISKKKKKKKKKIHTDLLFRFESFLINHAIIRERVIDNVQLKLLWTFKYRYVNLCKYYTIFRYLNLIIEFLGRE